MEEYKVVQVVTNQEFVQITADLEKIIFSKMCRDLAQTLMEKLQTHLVCENRGDTWAYSLSLMAGTKASYKEEIKAAFKRGTPVNVMPIDLNRLDDLAQDLYQAREADLEGGAAWLNETNHIAFVNAHPRLCEAIERLAAYVNLVKEGQ